MKPMAFFPIQIHANFNGPIEFLMGTLELFFFFWGGGVGGGGARLSLTGATVLCSTEEDMSHN